MRVLITGASGFVGRHLVDRLQRAGITTLLLTAKYAVDHPRLGRIEALDVTDRDAVDAAIGAFKPQHVVHLAGIAAPAVASADPQAAWRVHLNGTLNLAASILALDPGCALLAIGSGLIYGATANDTLMLSEGSLLAPLDDYAVTKAAADLALGALAHKGLKCIRFRPFNHTGPSQDEAFVVPSFAMQIARIEAGRQQPVIRVGNLDAIRDMLDVRDVVDAYVLGVMRAASVPAGAILNISSGVGYRVGDVLERLLRLGKTKIEIELDPARLRPSDLPRVVGDSTLAHSVLGWHPKYTLDDTLAAVLDDCRKRVT